MDRSIARRFAIAACVMGMADAVRAQSMTEMTPEAVKAALALGRSEDKIKPHKLKRVSKEFGICEFYAPYGTDLAFAQKALEGP